MYRKIIESFPDTDTIYSYDSIKEELVPQYAIFVDEEKGDYEYTHLWFRVRKLKS